jgi:hypothetical protein
VLIIRGSVSALFKASYLSIMVGKPLKTKKAKSNFRIITLPSIIMYLIYYITKNFLSSELALEVDTHMTHTFISLMVVMRCLRALNKILKHITKANKNSKRLKRLPTIRVTSDILD